MKILLTGATGYIGKRLLPRLIADGHEVVCCVRDRSRFATPQGIQTKVQIVEADFIKGSSLSNIPAGIDCAYYLVHSMSSPQKFDEMEHLSAVNFRDRMNELEVCQVIYLSGIANQETLSMHLASRKNVEEVLAAGRFKLTTLRAGIIVGSGSASSR